MMNFDPEELKKLAEKDPDALSDKIEEISALLGVDSRYIRQMLGSPEDIQQKLRSMSESDIRHIVRGLDPSIINKLKGRGS